MTQVAQSVEDQRRNGHLKAEDFASLTQGAKASVGFGLNKARTLAALERFSADIRDDKILLQEVDDKILLQEVSVDQMATVEEFTTRTLVLTFVQPVAAT